MRKIIVSIAVLSTAVAAAPASAKTTTVDAFNFGFGKAKIDKGDKVKWKSTDGDHDVTFKGGINFSQKVDEGDTTSAAKFPDSGTFKYICKIHKSEGMKGKVKVK
ncbi:MAG: Copper binding protein plastocyanin/azurin family [Thermoleophilaceae bacterium]|jgi:plastocyanin|nr:Copper binding protein plastocyanin/azurin family [Thermoleophilaceae bacterium]